MGAWGLLEALGAKCFTAKCFTAVLYCCALLKPDIFVIDVRRHEVAFNDCIASQCRDIITIGSHVNAGGMLEPNGVLQKGSAVF